MSNICFRSCSMLFLAVFLSAFGQGEVLDKKLAGKDCADIFKATGIDYRVGSCSKAPSMVGKGITVYDNAYEGYTYYTFSRNGKKVLFSSQLKRISYEGCAGEMTSFKMIPDTVHDLTIYQEMLSLSSSYYACLVVGTEAPLDYRSPEQKQISGEQKNLCMKTLFESDTVDTSDFHYVEYFPSGSNGTVQRYYMEYTHKEMKIGSAIAVVDFSKAGCKVAFFRSGVSEECYAYLCGQADMDSDGLSETFALSFGDYAGKWILTFIDGKWELVPDLSWPAPC